MSQVLFLMSFLLLLSLQALAAPAACQAEACDSLRQESKSKGLLQAQRQLGDHNDFIDEEEVKFTPQAKDADAGTTKSTAEHIQHLAELAQQIFKDKDPELASKAQKVEQLAESGADLSKHVKLIMKVIRKLSTVLTPAAAAQAGAELSVNDIANIVHKLDKTGHAVNVEEVCSTCFQGDMRPDSAEQLASFVQMSRDGKSGKSTGTGTPWHKGIITYCFDKDLAKDVVEAIGYAIDQFKKVLPCLQWKKVGYKADGQCDFSPAIFFQSHKNNGCWASVGMLQPGDGKAQRIQLESPGCDSVGTVIHEILHALGMDHEQSRPDRDNYVAIKWGNIKKGKEHNFGVEPNGDANRPYDILSIMHYGVTDFGAGKVTIATKPTAYAKYTNDTKQFKHYVPGDRIGMSQLDAEQLADHYAGQIACSASKLANGKDTCTEMKKNGKKWTDSRGSDCQDYVDWQARKKGRDCSVYSAGSYCCGCGGGVRLQHWEKTQPREQNHVVAPEHPSGDSTTYKDPFYSDTCAGWTQYNCHGFSFSAELYTKCPSACKCRDSGHGFNGESCDSWKKRTDQDWCGVGFAKSGGSRRRTWGSGVAQNCAGTCGLCPGIVTTTTTTTPAPTTTVDVSKVHSCKDSKTYKDPQYGDGCADWAGFRCTGYSFSDKLIDACPQACKKPKAHCCYDNNRFTMAGKQGCDPWAKSEYCLKFAKSSRRRGYGRALKTYCPVTCNACPAGKVPVES